MGNIVPRALAEDVGQSFQSKLLVFDANIKGYDRPFRVLIDDGASEKFCWGNFILKWDYV